MKLERILSFVSDAPWCITERAFTNIQTLINAKLQGASINDFVSDDSDDDSPFEIVGNTAILPVTGVILPRCSGLQALCGAFSLDDFKANLKTLGTNPQVSNVILAFDSPGGSVRGLLEAADAVNALVAVKPVYAFVGAGCMCDSAAYWIASQCSGIFSSKSGETGCIGVFMAFVDQSAAFEQEGLKVQLFKAGEQKAMGVAGTSLSDKDKEYLQGCVDKTYAQFTAAIKAKRPNVPTQAMQGLPYTTDDALALSLVDGQISDINSLVNYLNAA